MKSTRLFCFLTITILIFAAFLIFPVVSAADQDEDGLDDEWESENGYDNTNPDEWVSKRDDDVRNYQRELLPTFLFVLIGSFGIFSLILGAFTARYGAGRSRITGVILLMVGGVIGVIFLLFTVMELRKYPNDTLLGEYGFIHWQVQLFFMPLFTILAFGIGAFLAMVLFLVIIMKA